MVDLIAVIDTETTGLDLGFHHVIQHGMVLLDARTLEWVEDRRTYVRIDRVEYDDASKEALRVNGISWETLVAHGRSPYDALSFMYANVDWSRTLPAFWPVEFDRPFIDVEFRRRGLHSPMPRRSLDVRSACYQALFRRDGEWTTEGLQGFMKSTAELSSADLPAPPHTAEHDALFDATLTASALRRASLLGYDDPATIGRDRESRALRLAR